MNENKKLAIFEFCAAFSGLLVLLFLALPSYVESSGYILTGFQLVFGNERMGANGVLILGFLLVLLSVLLALAGGILKVLNRLPSDRLTMILGIVQALFFLAGGILLTCAILITGLDKANSELGLIQGSWSIGVSNYLVLVFTLVATALSYPCAMIILHHQDLAAKKAVETDSKA